ncbi:MAG: hypothetical protein SF052_18660 [Bacteroidia bacterium]|nr:hypothetical protein [Bacteroidia bacterium]
MNRGGSWNNNPQNCRVANRNNNSPENRDNNLGFRLAFAPPAQWKAGWLLLNRKQSCSFGTKMRLRRHSNRTSSVKRKAGC